MAVMVTTLVKAEPIVLNDIKVVSAITVSRGVAFTSEWMHPYKIITALSRKHPSKEIHVEFASSKLGFNCGYYTIVDGKITEKVLAPKEPNKNWVVFAENIFKG